MDSIISEPLHKLRSLDLSNLFGKQKMLLFVSLMAHIADIKFTT